MPLPPPVSPAARQIMQGAFAGLNKIISHADSRDFAESTIQGVREAALDIEKQLASRQLLRNMRRLTPLFQGLEHYSKVVEILCNGTPFLPWVWAPISMILRVSSEYIEAFEVIIKAYSRLAESLKRFSVLSQALASNTDFQQTLAVFYADILQFHGHAYKFVRRNGWRIFFMTSWGRFQGRFNSILEDMQRHEDLIDREANAYNITEAQKMRQEFRQWREEDVQDLAEREIEQVAKHFAHILAWLKADETDQTAIFDSISDEGARYPGTCSWVLQHANIKSWLKRSPDLPIIWMEGTPGSGKSVTATQLIAFMKNAGLRVAYHFCTYSYASSITYEQILRSLLLQLIRKDGELVAYVYREYVLKMKSPTLNLLEKLLWTLVGSLSATSDQVEYVWIVLDGLDECDVNKQARAVALLKQMTSRAQSSDNVVCKALVSSRQSSVLTSPRRKVDTVSLTDEKENLTGAIRRYAYERLKLHVNHFGQLRLEPTFNDELVDIIAAKSDGMFLYARLVLDFISSNIDLLYSGQELKDSVESLPKELADFYQNILASILKNKDQRSMDRIKCILNWIAFPKRPLKKHEIISAVTFSSGDHTVDKLVPQYIFNSIDTLVEEKSDSTLSFIHVSVKEFLISSHSPIPLEEADAVLEHGIAIITCLLSGVTVFGTGYPEHDRFLRLIDGIHGLHLYATKYWSEYLLAQAASFSTHPDLLSLALCFAEKLDETSVDRECDTTLGDESLDVRLSMLRPYPLLKKYVAQEIRARSLERLELEIPDAQLPASTNQTQESVQPVPNCGSTAMLATYQDSLRFLLEQHDYPGVSAVEFGRFKSHFLAAAFTCRLTSCPRATLGFSSKKCLQEHELSHVRRFPCTDPGCQYPPFSSTRARRDHISKHHQLQPPRKSIRKGIDMFKTNNTANSQDVDMKASFWSPPVESTAYASTNAESPTPAIQGPNSPTPAGLDTSKTYNTANSQDDMKAAFASSPSPPREEFLLARTQGLNDAAAGQIVFNGQPAATVAPALQQAQADFSNPNWEFADIFDFDDTLG